MIERFRTVCPSRFAVGNACVMLVLVAGLVLEGCAMNAAYPSVATRPRTLGLLKMQPVLASLADARAETEAADASQSLPDPSPPTAALQPGSSARIMMYSASMRLTVNNINDSLLAIRRIAETSGGFLQRMEADTITIKVPAARFNDAVSQITKQGEVVETKIQGTDVTEEMHDLKIRLENAQRTRQRLLDLLDRSDKVKDMLEVEKELDRVTETIELLKGKIRVLTERTTYSTITVYLNSSLPQQQLVAMIPFRWVRKLGSDLTAGAVPEYVDVSKWRPAVAFTLPKSYIKYYVRGYVTRGMSAQGVQVRVQRHQNYEGGDLMFWSAICRRALVENRAIAIADERTESLPTKLKSNIKLGTVHIASKPHGYLVGMIVTKRHIYVFEAWGPQPHFDTDRPKLIKAIKSMRIRG